ARRRGPLPVQPGRARRARLRHRLDRRPLHRRHLPVDEVAAALRTTMRLVMVAGVLAPLLARPGPARAHALLAHADPRSGSTASSPPAVLTLAFTEPIEAAFSRVE